VWIFEYLIRLSIRLIEAVFRLSFRIVALLLRDVLHRSTRQRIRGHAAPGRQVNHRGRRTEADLDVRHVREELRRYSRDVVAAGVSPRVPGQNAKVPVGDITAFSDDQVRRVFGHRPMRSIVCYPLGVWFGLYRLDDRFVVLVERKRQVQRLLSCDHRAEADAVWVVVSACAKMSDNAPNSRGLPILAARNVPALLGALGVVGVILLAVFTSLVDRG